jgi:subtilisin family serine protease
LATTLTRKRCNLKSLALPAVFGAVCLFVAGCGESPNGNRSGSNLSTQPANIPFLNDVLVQVRPGVDVQDLWSDYDVLASKVLPDGSTYRIQVGGSTADAIETLQSDDRIELAEENLPVKSPVFRQTSIAFNEGFLSTGDFFSETALSNLLGLKLAHMGSKGLGVKVAILDTGANTGHKVFQGRISPQSYDFIDGDNSPLDVPDGVDNDLDGLFDEATGHGTHVAGLVAMVAPASQLLILRVLNSDGQGTAFQVATGVEYAVDQGARVINLSIRLTSSSAAIDRAFDYARAHDVILVTSAGNSGYIEYPACDPRVWAIAALGTSGYPASFTSAFVGVVLSAPGENILSTSWEGGYSTWSGTSMSAAIVAGSAALVVAWNRDLTASGVLARLSDTARPIPGYPVTMGAGGVDPGAVVGRLPTSPIPFLEASSVLR